MNNSTMATTTMATTTTATNKTNSAAAAPHGAVPNGNPNWLIMAEQKTSYVSISSLLKRLATAESAQTVKAEDVAAALALVFTNALSPVQLAVLLWALHTTGYDHDPKVMAACADVMRKASAQVDPDALREAVRRRGRAEGSYHGGLCDIVGTGGDGHNTYNVSTTASIIASGLLVMAKHGNNSSTSLSGSADLLMHASSPKPPVISATTASSLPRIYEYSNYAFLYAREWHPGMRHAAAVRREVPVRTIMNLLGPLANPVHSTRLLETRIMGVARQEIGAQFAEALRLGGAGNAMVVCGDEDLDEVSCAGPTHCWRICGEEASPPDVDTDAAGDNAVTRFTVAPEDFGMPRYPLSAVSGGKGPRENAAILMKILRNELPPDDPVLQFVLLNAGALLALSGICEADTSNMGPGDDGCVITERGPGHLRWKEGVRRARWCVTSGAALRQWEGFVEATNAE